MYKLFSRLHNQSKTVLPCRIPLDNIHSYELIGSGAKFSVYKSHNNNFDELAVLGMKHAELPRRDSSDIDHNCANKCEEVERRSESLELEIRFLCYRDIRRNITLMCSPANDAIICAAMILKVIGFIACEIIIIRELNAAEASYISLP